jgi:hypothetical protein
MRACHAQPCLQYACSSKCGALEQLPSAFPLCAGHVHVYMQVPIAIKSNHGNAHVIYWIDSKATFGDHRMHAKQVEEQYRTYINRCVLGAAGVAGACAAACS